MNLKLSIIIIPFLLLSCRNDHITKVGIQPLDNFDNALIDTISNALNNTYKIRIHILESKAIPKETFINTKTPRYRADQIIKILKNEKPDSLDYIIALTDSDISTSKKDEHGNIKEPTHKYDDWGIFGLGYRPGPSCIVSTFRLRKTSQTNFIERVKKIAIHELGHNLGLNHCPANFCVMQDAAETIKTIDNISATLCRNCSLKIKHTSPQ